MRTRSGRTLLETCLAAASVFISVCALAHHSFSAEFDVGRPVEFTGAVMEIEWTNPHAWVHIVTSDEEGNGQRWAIELVGINALVRSGFNRRTVKVGDVLTISGFGARNGTNAANATSIARTQTSEMLWATPGFLRD